MKLFVFCRDGVRRLLVEALSWLNAIGAMLLIYALNNPGAPAELLDLFPAALQPALKLVLPLVWFAIVQRAKTFDAARQKKELTDA